MNNLDLVKLTDMESIDFVATRASLVYPSFCKLGDDGVLELYCDNMMLSSFRKCQASFYEQFMSHPSKHLVQKSRIWNLEFGQYLHKCLEYFYQGQRDNWEGVFQYGSNGGVLLEKQDYAKWLQICTYLWKLYDLEFFKDISQFKSLGGWPGMLLLYMQYWATHYQVERLKYVGWELSFGHEKEVPVLEDASLYEWAPFRAYLCGRIDLVVEDNQIIGPMDHKSTAYFDGTEGESFKPHDGMQGYVYGWQKMTPEELRSKGLLTHSMIINHISLRQSTNGGERFKRTIKNWTDAEMEEWRIRQIETFAGIYNLLCGRQPMWNTDLCDMWYYSRQCPYKKLHEVPPSYRANLVKLEYQIKEAWNPYRNDS